MENISKMEMATALFNQIYIKTEKAFFGLKTKITYAPTNSPVVGTSLEFAPAEGQKAKAILGIRIPHGYRNAICHRQWREKVASSIHQVRAKHKTKRMSKTQHPFNIISPAQLTGPSQSNMHRLPCNIQWRLQCKNPSPAGVMFQLQADCWALPYPHCRIHVVYASFLQLGQ